MGLVEGKANAHIVSALRRKNWATGRVAIIGSAKSGKTSLARELERTGSQLINHPDEIEEKVIATSSGLAVIDDFQNFIQLPDAQNAVFHLINELAEMQGKLVLFANQDLQHIPVDLPDLRSRLSTFEMLKIEKPDDDMIIQLLAKGFDERGVFVKADTIAYIAARVEREYLDVANVISALDASAIRDKGKITKARAKAYFESE